MVLVGDPVLVCQLRLLRGTVLLLAVGSPLCPFPLAQLLNHWPLLLLRRVLVRGRFPPRHGVAALMLLASIGELLKDLHQCLYSVLRGLTSLLRRLRPPYLLQRLAPLLHSARRPLLLRPVPLRCVLRRLRPLYLLLCLGPLVHSARRPLLLCPVPPRLSLII